MVTLFILLLLILGGVFMYLKLQKTDEDDEVTDTGDDEDQQAADKDADSAKKKEKAAKKALAAAKKSGDESAIKAAAAKAKKAKEDAAAKARKAAAAKSAAKAAADTKAKKEAAAKAAAFEKKKKAHAARLKREADEAKRREEEEKRQIQEAKRKHEQKKRDRQRALDNWGTGMGGGTSGFPTQGHYAVVGAKTGYLGQINAKLTNTKVGKMTMKKCHDLGRDLQKKKWPVSAVGYRTSAHPDPKWKNTCFFYGGWDHDGEKTIVPTGGRFTGKSDKNHAIACMNPGEVVNKGCKSYSYITKKMRAIRARRAAERRRLNEKPGGVQWRWGLPRHGWVNDKLNQGYSKIKNQSAKQCHQHAVNINKQAPGFVRLWGHYGSNYPDKNKRNTCFFYTANKTFMRHNDPKPPHFHGRAPWNGDRRHSSGCVERGKLVSEGCKDRSKINKEKADHRRAVVLPGNIHRSTGYRDGGTNLGLKPHQLKARGPNECRLKAIQLNKSGAGIKAWGFRNTRHHPHWKNTCFFYTGKGPHGRWWMGRHNHLTGCLKPGDNVNWGCTRTRPVNCEQRWTGWSACTKPCGGGTTRRDYKTTRNAQGIGRACKVASGAYAPQIKACNAHPCRPTARYVTLHRYDRTHHGNRDGTLLNLNQVRVWSNGRDVARGRPVQMYSVHHSYHGKNLTDGNPNSMAHTWWRKITNHRAARHAWMKIDLGREYPIDYVWVLNRKDCCQDRLKGFSIILRHGRKKPGAPHTRYEVMRSDRMTDTGAGWKTVLWRPAIGGTVGPMDVPGAYFRRTGYY